MNNDQPLTDEALDQITTWPAAFDLGTWKTIESKCQDNYHGINRRILLGFLTKDSEEMFKASKDVPETLFVALEKSAPTLAMYKRLVRMLEAAHRRLAVALCAVDFDAPDTPFSRQDYQHALEVARAEDDDDLN